MHQKLNNWILKQSFFLESKLMKRNESTNLQNRKKMPNTGAFERYHLKTAVISIRQQLHTVKSLLEPALD